jgi:hypothetical protein
LPFAPLAFKPDKQAYAQCNSKAYAKLLIGKCSNTHADIVPLAANNTRARLRCV